MCLSEPEDPVPKHFRNVGSGSVHTVVNMDPATLSESDKKDEEQLAMTGKGNRLRAQSKLSRIFKCLLGPGIDSKE